MAETPPLLLCYWRAHSIMDFEARKCLACTKYPLFWIITLNNMNKNKRKPDSKISKYMNNFCHCSKQGGQVWQEISEEITYRIITCLSLLYNSRKCVCNAKSAIFPLSNFRLSEKTKWFLWQPLIIVFTVMESRIRP